MFNKNYPWNFNREIPRTTDEILKLENDIKEKLLDEATKKYINRDKFLVEFKKTAKNRAKEESKSAPSKTTKEHLKEIWAKDFADKPIVKFKTAHEYSEYKWNEVNNKAEWSQEIRSKKEINNYEYNFKKVFEYIRFNSNLKWRRQDFLDELSGMINSAWLEWVINNLERMYDGGQYVELHSHDWGVGRTILFDFMIENIRNVQGVSCVFSLENAREKISVSLQESDDEDKTKPSKLELKASVISVLSKETENGIRLEFIRDFAPKKRFEHIRGWIENEFPTECYTIDFSTKKNYNNVLKYCNDYLNENIENKDTSWIL